METLMQSNQKENLKEKITNVFLMYLLVRGTLNDLGFTNMVDSSQLSGISFNKVIEKLQELK